VSDMDEVTGVSPGLAEIAGFWRRLFAFCLDGLLLGALGAGIGLFAYDGLAALGDWGRLVGFLIAMIYFGVTDSDLSKGQTLGKRIAGIKVVTANGLPLSVRASTLRATIFCVPVLFKWRVHRCGCNTIVAIGFVGFSCLWRGDLHCVPSRI
jgi:uncharacterized RDD family membrane protein YckC